MVWQIILHTKCSTKLNRSRTSGQETCKLYCCPL